MMFHVGQMVVCIRAEACAGGLREGDGDFFEEGRIYTIRAIQTEPYWEYAGLQFEEIRCARHVYYCASCFRPVKETSIEIFRRLVAPVDGDKVRA